MIRPRTRVAFGAVGAVLGIVIAAGGQGVTALAVSAQSPAIAPSGAKAAKGFAAEQVGTSAAVQVTGSGSGEKLVVKDTITDPDGSTHVRYDRTFNGLRVIGGDLVSHRDDSGTVRSVSWNTSHGVAVPSTSAKISLASAKATGKKKTALVQQTTSAPKGELVVYAGGATQSATPRLAYDVLTLGVRADQTPSRLHTIVDANTGAIVDSWDEIKNGTGNGLYVGTVAIGTTAGPPWSMRDVRGNYTTDLHGVEDLTGEVAGTTFTDADNLWGNGTVSNRASAGVTAHYGAGKTFDYFKNVLGRNGIWGDGVGARSRVHYGDGYVNAFWDGTQMTYGDGVGNAKPLVALDVAGHEMSHGVTEATAGLLYVGEAGGLNEATSDIFGTAVEWSANNAEDVPDYLIGEEIDLNGDGTPLRYLDRPSRDGVSPDCWSSTLGNLNVHLSSGPLNHWFYLASEGSGAKVVGGISYDSPTCNGLTVAGIGRDKAAKIWYRTLSTYLTSNSNYAAARSGAIRSAKDLYGVGSPECAGIAASFAAIAVPAGAETCGTAAPPSPPSGSNLLRNPGFESGAVSWNGSAGPITRNVARPAHAGAWKMWLGGNGSAATETESQSVTIASTAIGPKLSYWIRVDTDELSGSQAFDTMKVQIVSGSKTSTLATHSNARPGSTYSQRAFDLSAYKGKTVTVRFLMREDAALQTSFVVDDVAVRSSAGYTGVAPRRVLDTRRGLGAPKARVGARRQVNLTIPGLPAGTTAVTLNVTAARPSASGYLTVFPRGTTRPTASSLNFAAGRTVANQVTAKVAVGGKVSIYNRNGTVDLLADLAGYYRPTAGAGYAGVAPRRVLDTRRGLGAARARVGSGRLVRLTIRGLPAGTTAVTLNVTATRPSASGYLTVFPTGSTRPNASNLNLTAGRTVANQVTVKVAVGGRVTIYNRNGTVDILADLAGYYRPGVRAGYTGVAPRRVLDTRRGLGAARARVGSGRQVRLTIPGLPAGTTAVTLNVTATRPSASGYLTVFPTGTSRPNASNLNLMAGETVANQVTAKVAVGGKVTIYNRNGTVDILADLAGYFR